MTMKRNGPIFIILAVFAVFSFLPAFASEKEIPIKAFNDITGVWYSWINNSIRATMQIKGDGSMTIVIGSDLLFNGQMIFRGSEVKAENSMGKTATIKLFEGKKGKLRLVFIRDDGSLTTEWER